MVSSLMSGQAISIMWRSRAVDPSCVAGRSVWSAMGVVVGV